MLVAFCILPTSALAQLENPELDKKITLRQPAGSARVVIEQLSKATGIKLSTSLNRETLYLHVSDVSLRDVMSRLGQVTQGTWKLERGTYHLSRSAAVDRQQAEAERLQWQGAVQKSIDQLIQSSSPEPPIAQVALGWSVSRVVPKLLGKIGAAALVSLQDNERAVFATTPTRMQRDLEISFDEYSQLVAEDMNKYRAADSTEYPATNLPIVLDRILAEEAPLSAGTRRLKVALAIWRVGQAFYVSLTHFNSRGLAVLPTQVVVVNQYVRPKALTETPIPGPDGPLELSGEAMALDDWLNKGGREAPISAAMRDKLSSPDIYDPYSLQLSACLNVVAQTKGVQIVANLPDSLDAVHGIFGRKLSATVDGYLKEFCANEGINCESTDGWVTIRPSRPSQERTEYVDRVAFAKLLKSCRRGNVPLNQLAEFALTHPAINRSTVDDPYQLFFCPNTFAIGERTHDWDLLRFIGALTPPERAQFDAGTSIKYSTLGPRARECANQIAYWGSPNLTVFAPDGTSTQVQRARSWRSEPTELAPDGLPADLGIRISRTTAASLAFDQDTVNSQYGWMSPAFFAQMALQLEGSGTPWQQVPLLIADRTRTRCQFLLAEDVLVTRVVTDDIASEQGQAVVFGDWPESLRAAVLEQVEKERQRIADIRRRRPPPPPPSEV